MRRLPQLGTWLWLLVDGLQAVDDGLEVGEDLLVVGDLAAAAVTPGGVDEGQGVAAHATCVVRPVPPW